MLAVSGFSTACSLPLPPPIHGLVHLHTLKHIHTYTEPYTYVHWTIYVSSNQGLLNYDNTAMSIYCGRRTPIHNRHRSWWNTTSQYNLHSKCYASWCVTCRSFTNYTAWRWWLEKENHDLALKLVTCPLTRSFSHASHHCGHDPFFAIAVYTPLYVFFVSWY